VPSSGGVGDIAIFIFILFQSERTVSGRDVYIYGSEFGRIAILRAIEKKGQVQAMKLSIQWAIEAFSLMIEVVDVGDWDGVKAVTAIAAGTPVETFVRESLRHGEDRC
jgi:hypothetical protein